MGDILQGATERKRSSKLPRAPSSVRREVEVEEMGQEKVETAMHKMKQARRQGRRSAARDYGDGSRGRSHVDRKVTERVYAGGKDIEGVEDGPDSADMEE